MAVELDGHDFHEKTKEQSKNDKERDRILQSHGYFVARYTGSEIYNNPQKVCADEEEILLRTDDESKQLAWKSGRSIALIVSPQTTQTGHAHLILHGMICSTFAR